MSHSRRTVTISSPIEDFFRHPVIEVRVSDAKEVADLKGFSYRGKEYGMEYIKRLTSALACAVLLLLPLLVFGLLGLEAVFSGVFE